MSDVKTTGGDPPTRPAPKTRRNGSRRPAGPAGPAARPG